MDVALRDNLYALVQSRTGIVLTEHQRTDLAKLVQTRARPDNFLRELADELTTHEVWQDIVNLITVGETYFFRNQDQFDILRSEIFPSLIANHLKWGQKQLRIWSAGCASGEEPYSIAMLLRELLPDLDTWQITILATDINAESLARAQRGVYRAWSFRNETPDYIKQRWFRHENDQYKLTSEIRNMVIFRPLNLISDEYPTFASGTMNMDMVICRNVTIYFDQQTTKKIVSHFHRALTAKGWLVVGHSEPMASVYCGFEARYYPNTVLYQKVNSESAAIGELEPRAPVSVFSTTAEDYKPLKSVAQEVRAVAAMELPTPRPMTADTPMASYLQAKAAADAEDWIQALTQLKEAEAENKFYAPIYALRGIVQWQLGDLWDAVDSLNHAIYCDSGLAIAHYTLAEVYKLLDQEQPAIRHWKLAKQALEGLPSDQHVPFADDLTVEMLRALLMHRLDTNRKMGN